MSHIDKGALHAYLDGALDEYPAAEAARIRGHLDACGECADMLAAERLIRSDASTILSYASPDVELPTLEELRAYVKATRPAPRPAAARMYRMGWAASVVLALGAGWMARDGQLQQVRANSDFGPQLETEAASPAATPAEAGDRLRSVSAVGRPASEEGVELSVLDVAGDRDEAGPTAARKVTAPEAPAVRVLGEQELLSAVVVESDAGLASGEIVVANSPNEAGVATGGGAEVVEADDVFADQETASPPPPEVMAELVAVQDAPSDAVASARVAEQSLDSVAMNAGAAEPDEAEAKEEQVERRSAESLVPVTSAFAAGGRGVRQDELADDRDFEEEPALAVPGYEVLSVTALGEGSTPIGVQVVQRIEGDLIVELFRLEPGVDPGVLPPVREGRNQLRANTPGGWIVIRGALTEVQLRILVESLFRN
jgi:hypothetical protein